MRTLSRPVWRPDKALRSRLKIPVSPSAGEKVGLASGRFQAAVKGASIGSGGEFELVLPDGHLGGVFFP